MEARRVFVSLLVVLTCALIVLSGCSSSSDHPLSSQKAITVYSINGIAGTIDETAKTIAVTVPSLTNVYSLVATFSTTGISVKVGTTTQESGVTINNFAAPIAYTITAADSTTATYTVTVMVNREWHHPASLSDNISPDEGSAYSPQIAMDDNGNAIIVWYEVGSNGPTKIFKSEYRNGMWTHPASLAETISLNGYSAYAPKVAMDNNGNAIIVWWQYDSSYYWQIFKSEYRGGVWHHPTSLSDKISPDGQSAQYAQVAMDNNGNAIIVWGQTDGVNNQIFKSEYRGGVWHHPASPSDNISPDGKDARECNVAMDNNGNAIIVWSQRDTDNNYQAFKSEYRNGVWIHPVNISDNISPNGYFAEKPIVAMDNSGNAIIAWYESDGTYTQIFKSEYR